MRFIHLYLLGYFILILGAAMALWQIGAFHRIPGIWLVISGIVVIGLGIVLAVTSVRPTTISRE
jgi:hypothetical protein